uniref:Uncharacterized protein n=1 Tax=Arundo donax TaxID=35708 RepID=A0A0A9G4R8_ARUDO
MLCFVTATDLIVLRNKKGRNNNATLLYWVDDFAILVLFCQSLLALGSLTSN